MPTVLTRYKLIFFTPPSPLLKIQVALFAVGAGTHPGGKYTQCCFVSKGIGQFLPVAEKGANPAIGKPGVLEKVEELRVEILCVGEETVREAVRALKRWVVFYRCCPEDAWWLPKQLSSSSTDGSLTVGCCLAVFKFTQSRLCCCFTNVIGFCREHPYEEVAYEVFKMEDY